MIRIECPWPVLLLGLLAVRPDAQADLRYAPPTPGRLMLNAPLVTDRPLEFTLYLDKPGRFYAEAMFDAASCAVSGPTLAFSLTRGEKPQWARAVTLKLGPDSPHQTLFWLNAPGDVPYRTALTLRITPSAAAPAACALRLQITRKFELLPAVPR